MKVGKMKKKENNEAKENGKKTLILPSKIEIYK